MQNLGLSCTTRDARLIVTRYDTDSDSRIGFWEFANIFLPIDVSARTRLETRPTPMNKEISKETTRMIKKVLGGVVDSENMVEEIRRRVKQLTNSLRDLFDSLDWLQRGFLTVAEIRRHFDCYPDETTTYRQGGDHAFNLEIEGLIRRFNKDKLNGRITLSEFLDELTPKI